MVLGARPTVIRAFLCAETATDIAIQWMSKARIQNIFNKFLLQTKSVCPTKPRAISGVNIVSKILCFGFPSSCSKRSLDFLLDVGLLTN